MPDVGDLSVLWGNAKETFAGIAAKLRRPKSYDRLYPPAQMRDGVIIDLLPDPSKAIEFHLSEPLPQVLIRLVPWNLNVVSLQLTSLIVSVTLGQPIISQELVHVRPRDARLKPQSRAGEPVLCSFDLSDAQVAAIESAVTDGYLDDVGVTIAAILEHQGEGPIEYRAHEERQHVACSVRAPRSGS